MLKRLERVCSDSHSYTGCTVTFALRKHGKKAVVTDTQRKNIIYITLEENTGTRCLKERHEEKHKNKKDFVTPN